MESDLYIFDLDGTLANADHRSHYVNGPRGTRQWKQYFEACDQDTPIMPVIKMLWLIHKNNMGWRIFSGRSDEVREKTLSWLEKHVGFSRALLDSRLYMRPAGDYRDDAVLKHSWLMALPTKPVAVFDDRDKVVKMWRDNGIQCFQCNYGDF